MSELQLYIASKYEELGQNLDLLLDHISDLLGYYLPASSWKGHTGIKFLSGLGAGSGIHLRVRKDFFELLEVDLKVNLKYSPDVFVTMLLRFCKDEGLDFDTLVGSSWVNAPLEGNYVLGVLLTLLYAKKNKSFLCNAVLDTMKLVRTVGFQQKALARPAQINTALEAHFKSYKVAKKLPIKEGDVQAEFFADVYHKKMKTLMGATKITKGTRNELRAKENLKDAVRARVGNRFAQGLARDIGITDRLDTVQREMDAESEVGLFEPFDEDDDDEEDEVGNDVGFPVNINKTRALVQTINGMSVVELAENAMGSIKLTDHKTRVRLAIEKIHQEGDLQAQLREQRLQVELAQAQVRAQAQRQLNNI